jgi:hypothetical protein
MACAQGFWNKSTYFNTINAYISRFVKTGQTIITQTNYFYLAKQNGEATERKYPAFIKLLILISNLNSTS